MLPYNIQPCDNLNVCPAARMWPYITEAGERQARAMLPDMLQQNKPTWMTTLKLDQSVSLPYWQPLPHTAFKHTELGQHGIHLVYMCHHNNQTERHCSCAYASAAN